MAKIADLPTTQALTGAEHLPLVQDGATKRATLSAFRDMITPYLQSWYKGDKGNPGGDISAVGPFAIIPTLSIPPHISRIRTTGRMLDGDGGGAFLDRAGASEILSASGRGVWWTRDLDGASWKLAADQAHYAAMFGAMGEVDVDAAPILREALAAPMVKVLNLGALVHYIVPTLDIPPGKFLVGISRIVSGLRVIPIGYDDIQNGPRFAVRHADDRGGGSRDYFIDCARSGFDDRRSDTRRTHGLTVIGTPGNTCQGTRISNIDVHNTWGYAFYTVGQLGTVNGRVRNIGISDCNAYNFQVGFEATGDVDRSWSRTTFADASARDGGVLLPTEATYHEYGAIKAFDRWNATARGKAANGALIFTADAADIVGPLRYIDPDIDVDGNFGMYVEGRDGNRVRAIEVIGGRVASTGMGILFRRADVVMRQTATVGGDGPGVEAGTGAQIALHAPDIEGNRDITGQTGAYGITNDGAVIRWYGAGRLAANGPAGLAFPAGESAVDFTNAPTLHPATAVDDVLRLDRIITDRLFVIPAEAWVLDSPDPKFPGVRSYRAVLDLTTIRPGGVRSQRKTVLAVAPLEIPFPNGGVYSPSYTPTILWIDSTQVRVYINTGAAMDGCVMKVRVTEYE